MNRIRLFGFCAIAASLLAIAPDAEARVRFYPRHRARVYGSAGVVLVPVGGWYGGVGLVGTKIVDQRGGPEQLGDGAGVSVYGGIRIAERLSIEVGWLGSFHNPATVSNGYWNTTDYLVLEGLTADAKIHLNRSGGFDPYFQGGLGFYWLGSEHFGLDAAGSGFQLGGGFDYWLGDHWTLGVRARYHGISMGPPDGYSGSNNTYISALTVEGSIALRF